ncbi:hypothetical protein [Kitasatospora sp. LaBMicrA B282]|uniref:hypothetical protein n=1 Tax=Kitasatospora sp. LaBMicrA B282 TaxID=3420949 RepID=UPI003D0AE612
MKRLLSIATGAVALLALAVPAASAATAPTGPVLHLPPITVVAPPFNDLAPPSNGLCSGGGAPKGIDGTCDSSWGG